MDDPPSDGKKAQQTVLQRFNNVIKRVIFGCIMVSTFSFIIYVSPILLMTMVFVIQVLCCWEILKIGYNSNKIPPSVPYFRSLCLYFLLAANYFLSLEIVAPHFQDFYKKHHYLEVAVRYNRFISFCIYFVGIVLFVFSLVHKHGLQRFRILAWTHTLIVIIVVQAHLIISNMFNGLIWFILPVSLVILNDIFAYFFGRLFGRTPLIKVSPKKTWEGFIGGVFGTILSGFLLSNFMCQFKYFTCPIQYFDTGNGLKLVTECTPDYLFIPSTYSFAFWTFHYYPFTTHFLSFALFASIIAPFGGFCASGFKRAFKIKDFGDIIPGHGGIMDRFDCQFLMALFVNVYISTFVRNFTVEYIFERVMYLDEKRQIQFYHLLKDALLADSIIANSTVEI